MNFWKSLQIFQFHELEVDESEIRDDSEFESVSTRLGKRNSLLVERKL